MNKASRVRVRILPEQKARLVSLHPARFLRISSVIRKSKLGQLLRRMIPLHILGDVCQSITKITLRHKATNKQLRCFCISISGKYDN